MPFLSASGVSPYNKIRGGGTSGPVIGSFYWGTINENTPLTKTIIENGTTLAAQAVVQFTPNQLESTEVWFASTSNYTTWAVDEGDRLKTGERDGCIVRARNTREVSRNDSSLPSDGQIAAYAEVFDAHPLRSAAAGAMRCYWLAVVSSRPF